MSYVRHRLRSLIDIDPVEARRQLLAAFEEARAHRGRTAKILGCEHKSLNRWARMLGVDEEMHRIEMRAEEEGWHHGLHGGGHTHRDPAQRATRAAATRVANRAATDPEG